MLTESKLQQLFSNWKHERGVLKYGMLWIPIDGRVEAFKDLIKTLVEKHHYTQDDIDSQVYRKIIAESIPASSKGEKKELWKKSVIDDWYVALTAYFPEDAQILTHDSSNDITQGSKHRSDKKAYTPSEPDLGPVEVQKINHEEDFKRTGIPAPDFSPDEEFLALLRGETNE